MRIINLNINDIEQMVYSSVNKILSESKYPGLDDIDNTNELTNLALKNGFNLIGYHNTNNPNLTRFYYSNNGIHFGSLKAANDRGIQRDLDDDEQNNYTKKFFLKTIKPLIINQDFDWEFETFDDWSNPDDDKFYDSINIYAFLEKNDFNTMKFDTQGNPICSRYIKDILSDKGFDSIIYLNEKEDAGKYSIAMFYPNNIKLAEQSFDDNGNPIPLEKRFSTSDDFRY